MQQYIWVAYLLLQGPGLTQRDLLESSDLHVIIVPIGYSS
jgi:hypothetical protein